MHPRKLTAEISDDLAEVRQQIELWSSKAAELGPNIMAFAFGLSVDASQIVFEGDKIVFNAFAGRHSDGAPVTLDVATIRRIVCNLKILQARREQLEVSQRRCRLTTGAPHPP